MHGRALATDRGATQQTGDGEQDFACGDFEREHASAGDMCRHGQGGDSLRDTATFGATKNIAGEPGDQQ